MISVETFERAILFAVQQHTGQKRKGNGRPYIMHPLSVMNRIFENKKSKNMWLLGAAAVLHDTVEDCGVSLEHIEDKFGPDVAKLVGELTLDKRLYGTVGKKELLLKEMLKMSSYALAIKLCDRPDNVLDLEEMGSNFQQQYRVETWFILQGLISLRFALTPTHKRLIGDILKVL